jgi:hypothetical protein
MSEIAVDFLLGPDWTSRLIAYFGQGPGGWSHCASVLKDGRYLDARSDILGNVSSGIHIRDPKTEKWIRKRRATLQVTDAEYTEWEANLRAKITDGYARRDVLGFILNKDLHRGGTYDCSALAINGIQHVARAWAQPHLGYVPFPLPVPAHQVTPNALLLILATAGFNIGPVTLPS